MACPRANLTAVATELDLCGGWRRGSRRLPRDCRAAATAPSQQ